MALDSVKRLRSQRKLTTIALAVTIGGYLIIYQLLPRVTPPDPPIIPPSRGSIVDVDERDRPMPDKPVDRPPIDLPPPNDDYFRPPERTGGGSVEGPVIGEWEGAAEEPVVGTPFEPTIERQSTPSIVDVLAKVIDRFIASPDAAQGPARASGSGQRTTGVTALAILDIPGNENSNPWTEGELERIAEYVSHNTGVRAGVGARGISFLDNYASFDRWLLSARKRAAARDARISPLQPEIDALEVLAGTVPLLDDNQAERFRTRVRHTISDYFFARFGFRIALDSALWEPQLDRAGTMPAWMKSYLEGARDGVARVQRNKSVTGEELRGVYLLLRAGELMRLPVLLCDARGVPERLLPENLALLRTYVNYGGFIYFLNTSGFRESMGVRGLITELIEERLDDPEGRQVLNSLRQSDREVSGYVFRDPAPEIFHPWTFFPMILPRTTNVAFTVFNRRGQAVWCDTLHDVGPGVYLRKYRDYRWFGVDNAGNEVESGYYIYRIESDLACKTGAIRISRVRRLQAGRHSIFSSYFNLSEVPSIEVARAAELPYGEPGVFGVTIRDRLAICYTEGYREKDLIGRSDIDLSSRESGLKWVTNVVVHALAEGSLARL